LGLDRESVGQGELSLRGGGHRSATGGKDSGAVMHGGNVRQMAGIRRGDESTSCTRIKDGITIVSDGGRGDYDRIAI
jgi:hypothetical protein